MTTPTAILDSRAPAIDADRLWRSLQDLGAVGAYEDRATGLVGVDRLTLTDAEAEGRRLVVRWMRDAGLDVTVDALGNIRGTRAGTEPGLAPVLVGSHIDSVGTAGIFDGCLGVLGGLEVVRSLDEQGITTRRPVAVCVFTEEEGVRFGTDMLGSAVLAGRIPLDEALALTDESGVSLASELQRTGFDGDRPAELGAVHAYVECHIEQGPVLLRAGLPVGVVTGVQGISWQRVVIHGRAAHAGTTPTELRADAGLTAARIVVRLREMVESGRYGALRATVGTIDAQPGLVNVVPSHAELTVDLRHPDDELMDLAERDLADWMASLADASGTPIETTRMAKTRAVPFDTSLQDTIEQVARELGHDPIRLMSGAGHDAQEIAAVAPAAMIFVRGQHDGISHNPREYSTIEDCAAGVTVLAHTVVRLANQPTTEVPA